MPGRSRPDDDAHQASGTDRPTDVEDAGPARPTLRLEVVEYPDRARCTVHPPGLTGVDRMSTWLSADRRAFVDLDAYR